MSIVFARQRDYKIARGRYVGWKTIVINDGRGWLDIGEEIEQLIEPPSLFLAEYKSRSPSFIRKTEITTAPTGFLALRAPHPAGAPQTCAYLASRSSDKSRTLSPLVSDGDSPSL